MGTFSKTSWLEWNEILILQLLAITWRSSLNDKQHSILWPVFNTKLKKLISFCHLIWGQQFSWGMGNQSNYPTTTKRGNILAANTDQTFVYIKSVQYMDLRVNCVSALSLTMFVTSMHSEPLQIWLNDLRYHWLCEFN